MRMLSTSDFNLFTSLNNGQFHQWTSHGTGFLLADGQDIFYVKQKDTKIYFEGCDEPTLRRFLGLDQPYTHILKHITHDDVLLNATKQFPGMRLFKQDLWTCMVAFVISQNNNIKRIMQNVQSLRELCGDERVVAGVVVKTMPTPAQIASADLSSLRLGYREKYLKKLAQSMTPELLKRIENAPYTKAKELLITLPGIGPKVADCICLFALSHYEAFPIDTWMDQCLTTYYFGNELTLQQKQDFAEQYFGPYRGYAQQFLFQWMRQKDSNNTDKN